MSNFPKKYDHSLENEIYQQREDAGYFCPDIVKKARADAGFESKDEQFTISLPPPNVTGILHLGHALMLAVEDTMVRYHRMKGYDTLRVPGTDHAGIATQMVVNRQLAKKDITKEDLGREGFLSEVWKWVDYSRDTIVSQTKRMGASLDWSREQFTMSETLSRAVRKGFRKLYEKEKIYKDTYMVNRSPGAKTVVSDLEVEYKEEKGTMYYLRYFVEGKGDSIVVATVRPDTIFADVAIAVHPKDRRYKKWIGKNVLIPIVNRPIPVIADERVSIEFGTGALKITPAHAEMDFDIARDHNLPLDRFSFDKENKFTELAGEGLQGKHIADHFENFIQLLDEIGNLSEKREHVSRIPYCERSGDVIQPRLSTQWFMDVSEAASRVQTSLENQEVKVHPERFIKTFNNRLGEIRPRCISRQLRWGHRIPVRYDDQGNQYVWDEDNVLYGKSGKMSILSLMIFNLIADSRLANPFNLEELLELLLSDSLVSQDGKIWEVYCTLYAEKFIHIKSKIQEISSIRAIFENFDDKDADQIVKVGEKILDIVEKSANIVSVGDKYKFVYFKQGKLLDLRQEEDVLDTWFSSGLRPFSILGRPDKTLDLEKYYPNSVLETGYDIIFFWVIRMMLMGIELTDKMPFQNVYLHGLVRDEKGQKFSKSKGNTIDPLILVEKYGADALRGAVLLGNTPGNDQKFQEQKVEYVWRFINKMRNASRFVLNMKADEQQKTGGNRDYRSLRKSIEENKDFLNDYDHWMIGKINETIIQANKYQEKFMLGEALQESIDLVRNDFCDRYIEIAKIEKSTMTDIVMLYALGTFFKFLHPALPFVTEKLWQYTGFSGPLMISDWPESIEVGNKNYRINLLMEMISERRVLKQQVTDKPHESINIFVQANKDIQFLVEQHEELIKKIVRVEELIYLSDREDSLEGYQKTMIMDITLGAKGIKEINRKDVLAGLERQMIEEEQFLQGLRRALTSGDFATKAPAQVVEAKKQKMQEVKSKIIKIEFEINKLKMEHK